MRWLITIVLVLASLYVFACLAVMFGQDRLTFFPSPGLQASPADYGVVFEDVRIPVADRDSLDAWWIPGPPGTTKVLLFCHGNGANISANTEPAVRLRSAGISVLLFDYRGYGRSTPKFPSEQRVYEDGEAAWSYLVGKRHLQTRDIIIYGKSLGTAVAVELARHHPEAGGLVLESGFTSITDMARLDSRAKYLPLALTLRHRFDSIDKLASIKLPLLVIHGANDDIVPWQFGKRLYDAANQPKTWVLLPGAGHNDTDEVGGEAYMKAVRGFIAGLT